ncbi:LuxR C-terminal-related transcriptional regulator [Erythrobacter alti]|uniref:LuxR C-terminal-related transcriptional regulator n=1 Tax=Erythrobacter alti TaxID=1896145 RepID=UPI0030F454B0
MAGFNCSKIRLSDLPAKQLETAILLAEGLTGKEIAARLAISHSAVAQRIETLRRKFGGITKSELARLAREELSSTEITRPFPTAVGGSETTLDERACIKYTGQKNHLPNASDHGEDTARNRPDTELLFSDAFAVDATPPWIGRQDERLVPEVLDGENATVARWAYVVGAAIGLAILLLVLLAVADTLSDLA